MIKPWACVAYPCEADRAEDSAYCPVHLEESKTYKFSINDIDTKRKD